MRQIQQGDVILQTINIPKTAIKTELKDGIVQHGEATGHAHCLVDDFEYYETPKKERYLKLVKPCALRHEEHNKVVLPPGEYKIGIVREYNHFDEEAREVID